MYTINELIVSSKNADGWSTYMINKWIVSIENIIVVLMYMVNQINCFTCESK